MIKFNYLIADFISRINIANLSRHSLVIVPLTRMNLNLLNMFDKIGIIRGYMVNENYNIVVYLKYSKSVKIIKKLQLVSKPGKKKYVSIIKLKKIKDKYAANNILILSTSKGFLFDIDCLRENIGGEVILRIIL